MYHNISFYVNLPRAHKKAPFSLLKRGRGGLSGARLSTAYTRQQSFSPRP